MLTERRDGEHQGLPQAACHHFLNAAADQQSDQERCAHDGDDEQRFERRLGDELNDDDFPVGGGDQRTALQGGLDGLGERHSYLRGRDAPAPSI